MENREALRKYAEAADEAAFGEVVRDHGPWLVAAARRQMGDEHLAEDVTQAVFMLLAKRASRVWRHSRLSGWLFVALGLCVKHAKRDRARLARREKEAASMRKEAVEEARWEEVAPELEEAVGKLGKSDREVVLLRFYEQRPLAAVGRALGISEEAARKRVERAVGKLRGMLEKKGVRGTTAGLSALLVGNVVGQMPEGLVGRIVSAVVNGGGNTVAVAIAKGAMKMMVKAKVKVAAVVVAVLLVLATAVAQSGGTRPATIASVPATSPSAGAAFLSVEDVLKGWEASYGAVRSFDVSYTLRQDDKSAKGATTRPAPYSETDAIVDGEKFHVRSTSDPLGLSKGTIVNDDAFDGNTTTSYDRRKKTGVIASGRAYGSKDTFCLFFMHLGRMEAAPTMPAEIVGKLQLLKFHRDYANGGTVRPEVRLRPGLEIIAGEPCHVLEVNPAGAGIKTVTWFAHEKGMVIVRQELSVTGLLRTYEVSQLGSTPTDTGVFWFPARATMKFVHSGQRGLEQEFECRKFIPNPKVDDSAFKVAFPDGTRVYSEGLGRLGYVWRNGKAEPAAGQK